MTEDNSFNYVAVDNSGHLQVDIRSQRMAVQEITTAPDVSFHQTKLIQVLILLWIFMKILKFLYFITGDVSGSITTLSNTQMMEVIFI